MADSLYDRLYVDVPPNERKKRWWAENNGAQVYSVCSGLFIAGISGLHITWLQWDIYAIIVNKQSISTVDIWLLFTALHFGAITGSAVGAEIASIWSKRRIYYICGVMSSISSVLFIALPYHVPSIIVGRFIGGIVHSIVYLTALTHAAEICVPEIRGGLIGKLPIMSILISILILATLDGIKDDGDDNFFTIPERIIGIIGLILAAIGIVLNWLITRETTSFLLSRNQDVQAIANLLWLHNETVITPIIRNHFDDSKLMIAEGQLKTKKITTEGNLRPLLLMLAVTFLTVVCSNFILNRSIIVLLKSADGITSKPILFLMARQMGVIVSNHFLDKFRRKFFIVASSSLAGVIMIVPVTMYMMQPYTSTTKLISFWFVMVFQIVVSMGLEPMQHILLGEAFSFSKKYRSIGFVIAIENMFHLIIIALSFINHQTLLSCLALFAPISILVLTVILFFKLPETRGLSLREASDVYCVDRRST